MRDSSPRRRIVRAATTVIAAVVAAAMMIPSSAATANDRPPAAAVHVNPYSTTLKAAQGLTGQARTDAQLVGSIPSAEWFTGGTPDEVRTRAAAYVDAATAAGETPVLGVGAFPARRSHQLSSPRCPQTIPHDPGSIPHDPGSLRPSPSCAEASCCTR